MHNFGQSGAHLVGKGNALLQAQDAVEVLNWENFQFACFKKDCGPNLYIHWEAKCLVELLKVLERNSQERTKVQLSTVVRTQSSLMLSIYKSLLAG